MGGESTIDLFYQDHAMKTQNCTRLVHTIIDLFGDSCQDI